MSLFFEMPENLRQPRSRPVEACRARDKARLRAGFTCFGFVRTDFLRERNPRGLATFSSSPFWFKGNSSCASERDGNSQSNSVRGRSLFFLAMISNQFTARLYSLGIRCDSVVPSVNPSTHLTASWYMCRMSGSL